MSKITTNFPIHGAGIKIYIDDILHIFLKDLVSLYAYEQQTPYLEEKVMCYYIELTFADQRQTLDYDNRDLWIKILNIIDKNL